MGLRKRLASFFGSHRVNFQSGRASPSIGTLSVHAKEAKKRAYGNKENDIIKRREENRNIYKETFAGPVTEALVNTFFGSGYTLYSDDDILKQAVQDELDRMGFDHEAPMALREAYIQGYGFHEIAPTNGGDKVLVTRPTTNILPVYEPEKGDLIAWKQVWPKGAPIMMDPEDCIVIVPIPDFEEIGISLIERARKEIDYLEITNDASSQAIYTMGYPYVEAHISGDDIPADVTREIGRNLDDKDPNSKFVTAKGMSLIEHSMSGVAHVQDYQIWALRNVAVKMGVPVSLLGIQENSQSTAVVHYGDFYRRMAAEQSRVAAEYQENLIDRIILRKLGKPPGSVTLEFDNPDPDDLKMRAETVSALMAADPIDPYSIITPHQAGEFVLGKKFVGSSDRDDTESRQRIEEINRALTDVQAGGEVVGIAQD